MKETYKYNAVVDKTYQFEDVCEDLAMEMNGKILIKVTCKNNLIVVIETDQPISDLEEIFNNVEGLQSLSHYESQ